jgi:hypothetical protein
MTAIFGIMGLEPPSFYHDFPVFGVRSAVLYRDNHSFIHFVADDGANAFFNGHS